MFIKSINKNIIIKQIPILGIKLWVYYKTPNKAQFHFIRTVNIAPTSQRNPEKEKKRTPQTKCLCSVHRSVPSLGSWWLWYHVCFARPSWRRMSLQTSTLLAWSLKLSDLTTSFAALKINFTILITYDMIEKQCCIYLCVKEKNPSAIASLTIL